jgi:hypothetical protein
MGVGDEIRRLQQDIIALQSIDVVEYPENYSNLSQQAAIRGEYIAHKLRGLVYGTTNISKADYLANAADEMGINIANNDNGMVDITIPCLIPHRRKKQTGFITEPLYAALERFVSSRDSPFERFNHCVICITHVYDEVLFGKGRKRDHENIEVKGIIDVLNTFLLTDDNGSLCDIFHAGEISDNDFTRISVMKKSAFPEWVLGYKNVSEKLSHLT